MLTPEQQAAIDEWRTLHLKACPVCSATTFTKEAIAAMPTVNDDKLDFAKVAAFIPLVCLSCGYTVLVSTTMLRIHNPKTQPKRMP